MYNGIFERIDRIRANPVALLHCRECKPEMPTTAEYQWNYHAQSWLCPDCYTSVNKQMAEYQNWARERQRKKRKKDV